MVESSATEGTHSSRHAKMLEEYSSAKAMPPPDDRRGPRDHTIRPVFPRPTAGTKRSAESMEGGGRKQVRGNEGQRLAIGSETVRSDEAITSRAAQRALPGSGTFLMYGRPRDLHPSATRPSDATAIRLQVTSTLGTSQSRHRDYGKSAVSGNWNPNRGLVRNPRPLYTSFAIGAVLKCGHHVTAQNPHADPTTNTSFVQGPKYLICTKFRLGVVANVFENGDIFVLPSSTHEHKDLEKILAASEDRKKYYMVLRDNGDNRRLDPTEKGPLDVIVYDRQRKIGLFSSICLTEGFTIKQNEEVEFVGRLTDESIERMLNNLATVEEEALNEYRDRKREDDERIAGRDKLIPKGPSGRPHAGSRA